MPQSPLIPRDILFGNPTRANPRISPDGSMLAYIEPEAGVLNVWLRTIGEEDDRVVTDDRDRGIRDYMWSFDNRAILYVQDVGGDENWRRYATDIESGNTRSLTPFDNVQVRIVEYAKRRPSWSQESVPVVASRSRNSRPARSSTSSLTGP